MADLDLRNLTSDSPYDELYARLLDINSLAMRTQPSPRYDMIHAMLDILCDWMAAKEADDACTTPMQSPTSTQPSGPSSGQPVTD